MVFFFFSIFFDKLKLFSYLPDPDIVLLPSNFDEIYV